MSRGSAWPVSLYIIYFPAKDPELSSLTAVADARAHLDSLQHDAFAYAVPSQTCPYYPAVCQARQTQVYP